MNEVLKSAALEGEYYKEVYGFFHKYFDDSKHILDFLERVFLNDSIDKTPRRMMNLLIRWVDLAEMIHNTKPGRDPLVVACVRTCIESICVQTEKTKDDKKNFFEENLSEEGAAYIRGSFRTVIKEDKINHKEIYDNNSPLRDFDEMIFGIRNRVVHDGDYWSSQVFSHVSSDMDWVSAYSIERGNRKSEIVYETNMRYERFMFYFVEAVMSYIDRYTHQIGIEKIEMSQDVDLPGQAVSKE